MRSSTASAVSRTSLRSSGFSRRRLGRNIACVITRSFGSATNIPGGTGEILGDRPREGGDRVLARHHVGGQPILGGGRRRDRPDGRDGDPASPRTPLVVAELLGEVPRG